jgi:DNA polymerase-3 subunit alpha
MAGYSLGGADLLRRAMGKKDKEKMAKERVKFVEGAEKLHNVPKEKASEVFDVMEKFAEYGFNRSHAAAYSVVAYQTGYLKANYPAEFMAAVLSNNLSNIDKIAFFIDECRRLGIKVLGPCVNESELNFTVNKDGHIRFGMAAIKGVGENAVLGIIEERNANGPYVDFFEFLGRVISRSVNKKTLEALAYAGALDDFTEIHRKQYFDTEDGSSIIDKGLKYALALQKNASPASVGILGLFDEKIEMVSKPKIPKTEPWSDLEKLRFEKEVVSFYLSGHPLQPYKFDIDRFCTITLEKFNPTDLVAYRNRELRIAGIVTRADIRTQKNGNQFISFAIEDFYGKAELAFFKQDFMRHAPLLKKDAMIFLTGKYQPRFQHADQYEFRPMEVMLLSEVRSRFMKGIDVFIPVENLDHERTERMYQHVTSNPGRMPIRFVLTFGEEISVPVLINKHTVDPNNDFMFSLSQEYQIGINT